jgi:4-azaleucine resistance transporter AzlC
MIRAILKETTPIMFGYIPMGMTFGLLFQDLGYPWYFASVMAIFIFAGAAQFMAIGLLSAGAGLTEVFISTFMLNSRHIFYGLSILNKYGKWGLRKLYLIFGLTDETYSLVTTIKIPSKVNEQEYYLYITLFNQSYWVLGCTIGVLIGGLVNFNTEGMDFALTALFIVLVIEQWKNIKEILPFVIATTSSIFVLYFFKDQMLIGSILLSISVLLIIRSIKSKSYG